MKEKQRAETKKRSSDQLRYSLAALLILLVASATCNAPTGQEPATLKGHEPATLKGHVDNVMSVAFSPDGKMLASVGWRFDKTVKLWDARNGQELAIFKGHADHVMSVAFSPDGRTLASGSHDKTVKLWVVDVRQ